jgi:phospholipase/carboxylesterase
VQEALIIQQARQDPAAGAGTELLLLFHGVGSSAEDLLPLGEVLAAQRPQAWVVSVRSPDPSDFGRGWQWFSVNGITEANRPERVQAALPRFRRTVEHWQARAGADAGATVLIGFSQGAIMVLESTQRPKPVAGRVVAIAGRFAQPPRVAPPEVLLHLLHGEQDRVMPASLAAEAAAQWRTLGGAATLDVFAGLGHGIDGRVAQRVAEHLEKAAP